MTIPNTYSTITIPASLRSDCCSPSLRNPVQLPSGIDVHFGRNAQSWQQIAAFLGEPRSVVQQWASDRMPIRKRGRYVETTPDELNAWLAKESRKPRARVSVRLRVIRGETHPAA